MIQYQAVLLHHPPVWFEKPTTINPAALLPDDDQQVLIHDYHEMKGEVRYVGAAVVTLTEVIWYLGPESRTYRSDPGSQRGKRKVHHCIHQQPYPWCIIYRERGLLTMDVKGHQLGPRKGYLASPMNCYPPLLRI